VVVGQGLVPEPRVSEVEPSTSEAIQDVA
jgi:hypothetical protein